MDRELDPKLWAAIAGPAAAASVPAVGSSVLYFPQGHAEYAYSPPDFTSLLSSAFGAGNRVWSPLFHCRVADVRFLAHSLTDEVFARILLRPCNALAEAQPSSSADTASNGSVLLPSHVKVLTESDANNGGGFSVPVVCAQTVLPPLDMAAEMPLQILSARDVQGQAWTFRHVFRGMPRRHILTTGWSKFVNAKSLVAGDGVAFVRDQDGQLHIGIQRVMSQVKAEIQQAVPAGGDGEGYKKNPRGRIPPQTVVDAVRLASTGEQFEVAYYPVFWLPDIFIVPLEDVIASIKVDWVPTMQVRMRLPAVPATPERWVTAQVTSIDLKMDGLWAYSPWQMLQVTWYEDPKHRTRNVNPWQLELISEACPCSKIGKIPRHLQVSAHDSLLDADGRLPENRRVLNDLLWRICSLSFTSASFPAGMQGIRHGPSSSPAPVSSIVKQGAANLISGLDCDNNKSNTLAITPKEMSIKNTPQSESLSLGMPEPRCIQCQSPELSGNAVDKPTEEPQRHSLKLFGQLLQISKSSISKPGNDAGQ